MNLSEEELPKALQKHAEEENVKRIGLTPVTNKYEIICDEGCAEVYEKLDNKIDIKFIGTSSLNPLNDFEMVEVVDYLSKEWNETPIQTSIDEETRIWSGPIYLTMDIESNGKTRKIHLLDSDPEEVNNFDEDETHVQYDSQENDYSHEILQEQMYA